VRRISLDIASLGRSPLADWKIGRALRGMLALSATTSAAMPRRTPRFVSVFHAKAFTRFTGKCVPKRKGFVSMASSLALMNFSFRPSISVFVIMSFVFVLVVGYWLLAVG